MKRIALVTALALAAPMTFGQGAFGQTLFSPPPAPAIAQPPAPPVIVPPAAPDPDQPADAARLALARQLIDIDGGEKQVADQVDALYSVMFTKMAEKMSSEGKPVMLATQLALQNQMHRLIRPMLDLTADVYSRNYTEQQLRDIIAFRRSPTGQAVAEKTPMIQRQAVAAMLPLIVQDMPRVMHSTVDAVCKSQSCTPEMRAELSAAMQAALGGGGTDDGPSGVTVS